MKSPLIRVLAYSLLVSVFTPKAEATWYKTKADEGMDLFIGEVQWPRWSPSTYFTLWNSRIYPDGGYFYGGFTSALLGETQKDPNYKPQLTWSFWDSDGYEGKPMDILWYPNEVYGYRMDFEGAIAGYTGNPGFVKCGKWYQAVLRTWQSVDQPKEKGYIGWWMKDMESGQWSCIGLVGFPTEVTGLAGNSGFVEELGYVTEKRYLERRNWYFRDTQGKWQPSDEIRTQGLSEDWFVISKDGTTAELNYPAMGEKKEEMIYRLKQDPTPKLGELHIDQVTAKLVEGQILVDWSLAPTSAPQLGYQIEAFAEAGGKGGLLASLEERMPHHRLQTLSVSGTAKSLKFTLTDIFDQKKSVVVELEPATLRPASEKTGEALTQGIALGYFDISNETLKTWKPSKAKIGGFGNRIDAGLVKSGVKQGYALTFDGYFRAAKSGAYVFEIQAADEIEFTISGQTLIARDGACTPTTVRKAIMLAEGQHLLSVKQLKTSPSAPILSIRVAEPGGKMRELGRADLFCDASELPSLSLRAEAQAGGGPVTIGATVGLNEKSFDRLEFYRNNQLVRVINDGSELGEAGEFSFQAMLPAGPCEIRARLWYDGGHVFDSEPMTLTPVNRMDGSWKLSNYKEQNSEFGIDTEPDRVRFSGETPAFVYREIKGDFSITARISEVAEQQHKNAFSYKAKIGLAISPKPAHGDTSGMEIMKTSEGSIRGFSDDRDLAGDGMNRYPYGREESWVKIVRRGKWVTSYISMDGKKWRKVADEIKPSLAQETLYVGVFGDTLRSINDTLFSGTVDHIRISRPGDFPEHQQVAGIDPKLADPALGISGLVGPRGGNQVFARSGKRGLWVSHDGGKKWSGLNQGLSDNADAMAVRSVAVHPSNPKLLLRGGGVAKSAGIWRSEDAGSSWKLVSQDIDFDGTAATAIMGETISFNPHDPNIVAAAGESSGLFLSRDAGATWAYLGLKGERISCVAFNPFAEGWLVVGTCPDAALRSLGLPVSQVEVEPRMGRLYRFQWKSGSVPEAQFERPAWGVCDLGFDCFNEASNFVYAATTEGIYYGYNRDLLHQMRHLISPNVAYLGLDEDLSIQKRSAIMTAPFQPLPAGEGGASPGLLKARISYVWYPYWEPVAPGDVEATKVLEQGVRAITLVDHQAGEDPSSFLIATSCGVFKTTDGGKSFKQVLK